MLENLDELEGVLYEIERLNKRSSLLEDILNYYNVETMTFDIPAKWKHHNIKPDKLPAKSPRHLMRDNMKEALSIKELINIGIFDY